MVERFSGAVRKSRLFFRARSSTIIPKAPIVEVMDVTAISPDAIQLSIRKRTPGISSMPAVITSPKNRTYRPIIIMTLRNEKKTDALSRKKIFKFRTARLSMVAQLLSRDVYEHVVHRTVLHFKTLNIRLGPV